MILLALRWWFAAQLGHVRAWRHERRRVRELHSQPFVWKCMRVGGGGVFETPPLRRAAALRYATLEGSHQIAHVDDDHKHIFYRSI